MEIKLSNCDLSVLIDSEDLNKILDLGTKLFGSFSKSGKLVSVGYNIKTTYKRKGRFSALARFILNYYGPLDIDHIDRNPLNNKKDNLRIITHSNNCINRGKLRESKSKYKGIYFSTDRNKWRVSIAIDGKRIHGGDFKIELDAARQANTLMKMHQGEFAVLNPVPEDN